MAPKSLVRSSTGDRKPVFVAGQSIGTASEHRTSRAERAVRDGRFTRNPCDDVSGLERGHPAIAQLLAEHRVFPKITPHDLRLTAASAGANVEPRRHDPRQTGGCLGGSDRRRSGDLTIFSRALYQLSYRAERSGFRRTFATLTGLEPATSAVTGRRANQLRYRALLVMLSFR